ncbi:hypothetical protein BH09ACT8_BH09ACT8_56850 [soil metagenome]
MRVWVGSVFAGSAVAAGVCLCTAATAQADTAESAVHSAAKSATNTPGLKTASPKKSTVTAARKSAVKVSTRTVEVSARTVVAASAGVEARAAAATAAATTTATPQTSDPTTGATGVTLAVQQLTAAKNVLASGTSTNPLAGVAALFAQNVVNDAKTSLTSWQDNNAAAQAQVAATVGTPIVHEFALVGLAVNELQPSVAQAQMNVASLLIPIVGVLGASDAATQALALVSLAAQNGRVYAVIPVTTIATTEPVVYISVNGGPRVPVLIDTGSEGLVIDPRYVGTQTSLGTATATGSSGYSGGLSYDYGTYTTTVDFGYGVVTAPTSVDIVDAADAQAFANYFDSAGVVGVLGVGPNAIGPGPSIVTASLPGLLGEGLLLNMSMGYLVLGPNPLPVRVSVPNAPNTTLMVQINNGQLTSVDSIIDSGGVYGTMPSSIAGQASGFLPVGTKIAVFTADGATLLYSFTTTSPYTPGIVSASSQMNTGYYAFKQGPVYIGFDGTGTTSFDYL